MSQIRLSDLFRFTINSVIFQSFCETPCTRLNKRARAYIHVSTRIRIHDPSVQEIQDRMCLDRAVTLIGSEMWFHRILNWMIASTACLCVIHCVRDVTFWREFISSSLLNTYYKTCLCMPRQCVCFHTNTFIRFEDNTRIMIFVFTYWITISIFT
jgi:hypothetical protein